MSTRARVVLGLLLAFIAIGTAQLWPSQPSVAASNVSAEPVGYPAEMARIEKRIAAARRLMKAAPRSWMRKSELAVLLMERAALSGKLDDYAEAERLIEEAIASGPAVVHLRRLRAELNFTLHRFDRVTADLEAPLREAEQRNDAKGMAALLGLRGSLAFELGDYAEAEKLLARAAGYDGLVRLAHLQVKTCRFDEALESWKRAEAELPSGAARARAWIHLQRGLMALDRGQYSEALRAYQLADGVYPGWWLVAEHIAEIDALQGRKEQAIARYERVVEDTGSPELIDALADLVEEPQAGELRDRATALFRQQLEAFPEASYGHALDHFLSHGPIDEAVRLAEKNRTLRPNGEARTKLAQAYLRAGRLDDAQKEIEASAPHCSAELHATAAAIAKQRGDSDAYRRARAAAEALNPRISL